MFLLAPRSLTVHALALLFGLSVSGGMHSQTVTVSAIAKPRHDLRLGFTESGRVVEVLVQPGATVTAGQPLVRLDSREAASQLELISTRSGSTLEIESAQAAYDLARNEEASVREAFNRGGASEFELRRAELRTRQAQLTLELQQREAVEIAHRLALAQVKLEHFTLTAPMSGIVEDIVVEPGEMVEALKPVLRLVVTDPLRIDAHVPSAQSLAMQLGDEAVIRFEVTGPGRTSIGRIVHLASVADAASETRLVRIEVPNPSRLPAGTQVRVEFDAEPTPTDAR